MNSIGTIGRLPQTSGSLSNVSACKAVACGRIACILNELGGQKKFPRKKKRFQHRMQKRAVANA